MDWFVFSRISYSWNHIVGILYLASVTQIIILKFIHVDVSVCFLSLSSILLYGCSPIYRSLHLLISIYVVSSSLLLQIKLPWTLTYKSVYGHMPYFLLDKYLEWNGWVIGRYIYLYSYRYIKLSNKWAAVFNRAKGTYSLWPIKSTLALFPREMNVYVHPKIRISKFIVLYS